MYQRPYIAYPYATDFLLLASTSLFEYPPDIFPDMEPEPLAAEINSAVFSCANDFREYFVKTLQPDFDKESIPCKDRDAYEGRFVRSVRIGCEIVKLAIAFDFQTIDGLYASRRIIVDRVPEFSFRE